MAYKFFKIKVLDQRATMVIDKLLNEMKINYNCQSNGVSSTYSVLWSVRKLYCRFNWYCGIGRYTPMIE